MEGTIPAFLLHIHPINSLRRDTDNRICVLLNSFVNTRGSPFQNEHEKFRLSSFLLSHFLVKFLSGTLESSSISIGISISDDRLTIDHHSIVICSLKESL